MPEADQGIIAAVASVVIVASRGPLAQQLGASVDARAIDDSPSWAEAPAEAVCPLPSPELVAFNGIGGFTPDGREYVVDLDKAADTPAPWINVIANPSFGLIVSERGSGSVWHGNSQRNRLTPWSNDPVVDQCAEALYLRDEGTGRFWTPTAAPVRDGGRYRVRHGAGYSVFEHNADGLETLLTVFVPMDPEGGRPLKLQVLRIKNAGSRARSLSLTYYAELVLGECPETSRMHVVTDWDEELGAIMARNRYRSDYGDSIAFLALGSPALSYSGDRLSFIGRGRSMESPDAMGRASLGNRTGAGYDPCAALRVSIELARGEEAVVFCMLGEAESTEAARSIVLDLRCEGAVEEALAATKAWWDDLLGTIEVHTPDAAEDILLNRWLLYQDLSCRIWGRSAFYQSGGAFGFRDQIQDVTSLLYAAPEIARGHLLAAASRQFREGDVQHWWHPERGEGIRSRISDDMLWLPYAVAQYLRISGDRSVLGEIVPFIDGRVLAADEREAFFAPTVSAEAADLFEHCRRAVERGFTSGQHGLPLMGTGDWNDGMNEVGREGKGESVWLAFFLVEVLGDMAELCDAVGQPDAGAAYLERRAQLVERIEAAAWDGEWYIRAISDDGSRLGSKASREASIDSLPQSWSCIALGPTPRARQALESARLKLVRPSDGVALLFSPPYDVSSPSPGYIQAYPPGIRENGGQYTHAALWLAIAMARSGDGTHSEELLRMLNPIEHALDRASASRYATEPYAVAADVSSSPDTAGRGGWSWYTGSASWMYRAWIEEVLGFRLCGDRLSLNPTIPGAWAGFSIVYRREGTRYDIRIENPDHVEHGIRWMELDNRRIATPCVPLEAAAGNHVIYVRMG